MTRLTHGERQRRRILETAADLSTHEGLGGLSLARIGGEVGLTKPGVAAHFESKQALQLAVVEAAAAAYAPPLAAADASSEPGLSRLRARAQAWLEHLEARPYRGGCFFAAAGHAFHGRPGPVRDRIAQHTRRFLRSLEEQAELAARLGELRPDVEPQCLAFSVHALAGEANLRRELLDESDAFRLARETLNRLLHDAAAVDSEETCR